MKLTHQLAKHLRDVHFGRNWTTSNFKDQLKDISWEEAIREINGFNSIAKLTVHATYYVIVLANVLEGNALQAKDELSFIIPTIQTQQDWENILEEAWRKAERAAQAIEELSDEMLERNFVEEKYGTYYRNIAGVIEHLHYHLGQIVLIRKLIRSTN